MVFISIQMNKYDLIVLLFGGAISLALLITTFLIKKNSKEIRREVGLINDYSNDSQYNYNTLTKYFPFFKGLSFLSSKSVILFIDILLISIAFLLSYLFRSDFSIEHIQQYVPYQLPIIIIIFVTSELLTGSHKGIIFYTGFKDVYNIFNTLCLGTVLCCLFVVLNGQFDLLTNGNIPLSVILISVILSFIFLLSFRYSVKSIYHSYENHGKEIKNVVIYGAGPFGIITHNALTGLSHTKDTIKVIGYIDSDANKIGRKLNGLPIYSKNLIDSNFLKKKKVSEIIVALSNLNSKELREFIEPLIDYGVKVKIIPPVEDWINGEIRVSSIKTIQIEDLLDREPINIKKSKISSTIKEKVIWITGGAGSIGSEIVRQICRYNYTSLIIIDISASNLRNLITDLKQNGHHNFIPIVADVSDKGYMHQLFDEYTPDIIIHSAAYNDVPLFEYNVYEAIRLNVRATKILADLSQTYDVSKFVFLSSDKAVNPTNVIGATKRIAEMYLLCLQNDEKTKFITCRFGNILGSYGSVIPLFKKQIEKGGPITVTHKDITRYFMTIPEAADLVLESGSMGTGGEIFLFDMGESVKILDLAKNMIKLSGLKYPEDIDIKITGLRPGEKLYSELLGNGENTLPTYHKKILINKVRELNYSHVRSKIEELCVSSMFFNDYTIKLMKDIVPEYISSNSDLTRFDKKEEEQSVYNLSNENTS